MLSHRFVASRSYRKVNEQLVCQRGSVHADSLADLPDDVIVRVAAHTSYAEALGELQEEGVGPSFELTDAMGTERLLQEVAKTGAICTVGDSTIVAVNRRVFPNLDVVLTIGEPRELVWYAHPAHEGLAETASSWMQSEEAAAESACRPRALASASAEGSKAPASAAAAALRRTTEARACSPASRDDEGEAEEEDEEKKEPPLTPSQRKRSEEGIILSAPASAQSAKSKDSPEKEPKSKKQKRQSEKLKCISSPKPIGI